MRTSPRLLVSVLTTFVFLSVLQTSSADTPLPPPKKKEVLSNNKQFCAVMDPRLMMTTVYRIGENSSREKAWAMYGWFRVANLADDGEHLVVGYDGMNLVPLDIEMDDVMIYFFRKGELINHVTLGELVKNKLSLKRTASHYLWGSFRGINQEGDYVVETVEGRTVVFDVATGKPME
jgi:hypothetical protein